MYNFTLLFADGEAEAITGSFENVFETMNELQYPTNSIMDLDLVLDGDVREEYVFEDGNWKIKS